MLPGKKYQPEDFARIGWARKWFIVIPVVLIGGGTFIYAHFLPDQYRATTTILVVPQRVPENYVRPTVTADVSERLQTISQQILSRTRLERIIEEFNLYSDERKTLIMEDVVERMRTRDINLNVASANRRGDDASSFTVSFISSQPRTAMQVTERLASLFVQENLEERELLADSTTQFLQAQLEDARRQLIEHEKKLEAFRRTHAGRLPSQANSNLQMVQTTQSQLMAIADAGNRDRDRLLTLEQGISELMKDAPVANAADGDVADAPIAQRLEAARVQLRGLELRYKEGHPDLKTARRVVAELEAKADAEALNAPVAIEPSGLRLPPAVAEKLNAMRLEAQEIRTRLETRKREEERLRGQLSAYVGRLEAAPTLESELTELMRDYGTLQETYNRLRRNSEDSKLALNLERRQIGEQFKVVDGARLPERPFSPDRRRINTMGLAAGLALGIAIVGFLEYRDTTLKTDADVMVSLSLPVLAVIPAMLTAGERKRLKRRRLLLFAAGSAAVLLAAAGMVVWKLRIVQEWIG